jgi:hypothetical protein
MLAGRLLPIILAGNQGLARALKCNWRFITEPDANVLQVQTMKIHLAHYRN